ncbi:MAG: hypothetical protein ACOYU7_08520 [Bacillota bacterium]
MARFQTEQGLVEGAIRVKIRLDFKGVSRPGRFFLGSKSTEKVAEEIREQQIALFRNVPLQGVVIEDINLGGEIYTVYDDAAGTEVAFAPVELVVAVESLEDIIRFAAREEFRRIEVLEPGRLILSKFEIERLLFRINEEIKSVKSWIERKYAR